MSEEKKIVEVMVKTDTGEQVPIGLMNTRQAMKLPNDIDVAVSHPDDEPGSTDRFVGREELRLLEGRQGCFSEFPTPSTDFGQERSRQALAAVKAALKSLVVAANTAGWGTAEVVDAIVNAGRAIKEAELADPDPDPADDPNIGDAAREQIGRGEIYD